VNIFWDEEVAFIPLFGEHHLIYMVLMLILLTLLMTQCKFIKQHADKISYWILAFSIGQQILLYSWYIFETGFDVAESLPLHISRISSILGIIYLITKNQKVLNLLFYFGLYAYGTFFYPQRVYPVYHVIGVSFFINHAITILLPIFVAIAYDWRPKLSGAFNAYLWFLFYFWFVYFLNPLLNGNYFYLKYRPFFDHLPDYLYIPLVLSFTLIIFLTGYYLSLLIEKVVSMKKVRSVS